VASDALKVSVYQHTYERQHRTAALSLEALFGEGESR